MSKRPLILMLVFITLLVAPIYATDLDIDGLHMNGLLISSHTWYPTHNNNTIVMPAEITNESGVVKEDVRIYTTGVMASPWGLLTYIGNGRWEKTSQYTADTLQAKVSGPKESLPSDQERNVAPGSSLDASYPYVKVGKLYPGETKSAKISVNFQVRGGGSNNPWIPNHYCPYTFWLCLADGGQKVPQSNRPPTAYDATVTTAVDTPVQITLNATDPDGDDLIYEIGGPADGTLTGDPPYMTYTPDPGFIGTDYFNFMASDKKTESNIATVTIMVGTGTVPVQYYLSVDDYGDLYIDGQLEAHYDAYPQGGDMTDVLDLSPGWHDIDILIKNRWGSSSVGLLTADLTTGDLTIVPLADLRSLNAQGQYVSGLKAEYYTSGGTTLYKTVYGEGPIWHVSGGDTGYRPGFYQGVSGPIWVGLWDKFEERLSGQILVGQ